MKIEIGVVGCNWLSNELFNIAEPEFKNGRMPFPVFSIVSNSPGFDSASFFTVVNNFGSVSLKEIFFMFVQGV